MSDEHFLARWSRRKQEAKGDQAGSAPEKAVEADGSASSDRATIEPVPSETEVPNLPAIESIDAATDITAFLRKGIPQELSRAALRRAWSADPAIRDFVGLAENAWDFNDPNAMVGFGPLDYSTEQVDALVHRILGGLAETAGSLPNALTETAKDAAQTVPVHTGFAQSASPVKAIPDPRPFDEPAAAEFSPGSAASQPETASQKTPPPRRTHGGALPR
jgi:uncharacterized protein DUF3306